MTINRVFPFQALALLAVALLLGAPPGPAAAQNKSESVLGPGDLIKISVFQNPDLTLETRVSEAGGIVYPLIGAVKLGGLTATEAAGVIAARLREGKFLNEPQVNVLVLTVRGNQVAVLGQVNRPGRYPIEVTNTRVSDMLALAGGITATGSDTIVLVGTRDGKPYRAQIDVPALFQASKGADDLAVAGGDVLYVDRAPQFFIYGEVQRPGAYRLDRGMSVMQALAQGGGLTQRGTERGLRLHRRDASGRVQVREPTMDEAIQADDVIYVRQSIF
ncbi:MAG: polysaccharide export protein EpsE [Burkholderiales bacterium]